MTLKRLLFMAVVVRLVFYGYVFIAGSGISVFQNGVDTFITVVVIDFKVRVAFAYLDSLKVFAKVSSLKDFLLNGSGNPN